MRFRFILLLIAALAASQRCAAQDNPEPSATSAPESALPPATPVTKITPEREVSWRLLGPNLLQDQKRIWMFPVSVAHGHHLKPTIAVLAITAALAVSDERIMKPIQTTQSFNGFNKVFSGFNTSTGMEVFPAVFYAIGLMRKDTYAQQTVLLAGEAVIDSEILTTVLKDIDRRYRPNSVPPGGDLSASWFKQTQGSYIGGVGSFPSGHTIAAFSLATVFADRYPNPRWHVWLAYGLAGLVGFSRATTQSHFPSDVFAGAALGYVIAHYVVRHPRENSVGDDLHSPVVEPQVQTAGASLLPPN
jgi:membrane-associated phospholipid phosphatase